MADWKQITARIRRARGSRDPGGQLALLFEKTSDAMVAFELGRHFEITKDSAKSLEWYLVAARRFRRGEWKTKAREAVVRMGGELPPETESSSDSPAPPQQDSESTNPSADTPADLPSATTSESAEPESSAADSSSPAAASENDSSSDRKRRRGRRGGRNRRKSGAAAAESSTGQPRRTMSNTRPIERPIEHEAEIAPPRVVDSRAIPRVPVEQVPDSGATGVKGRFGDPGLSSRLSILEMQLRRLLTCPPAKLEDSAIAPAGPGVFVLTDDEMTTYYYVEACDTLRIALSSLARTGMTRRGNTNLKSLLADNLGITEARVSKYLAEHCVVRWLQLDEGAVYFQHFTIAVLRPSLNG
jgi:hypothetical protein